MMEMLFDTKEMETERDRLLSEAQVISETVQQNINENAHSALDQMEYRKRYDELAARYDSLKTRIDELNRKIHDTRSRKADVRDFLTAFEKLPDQLMAFTLDAYHTLTDFITVYSEKDIRVTFRNGQEVRA